MVDDWSCVIVILCKVLAGVSFLINCLCQIRCLKWNFYIVTTIRKKIVEDEREMMTNAKLVGVYHEDDPSDEDGSPVGSGRVTKTALFSFDYLLIFEEIRFSVMGLKKDTWLFLFPWTLTTSIRTRGNDLFRRLGRSKKKLFERNWWDGQIYIGLDVLLNAFSGKFIE